jgi:hypothetical protein
LSERDVFLIGVLLNFVSNRNKKGRNKPTNVMRWRTISLIFEYYLNKSAEKNESFVVVLKS